MKTTVTTKPISSAYRSPSPDSEFGTIKQGQALIWYANLLHGGAAQTDLSRSRHSQVTHYYFENCTYYTDE